MTSTCQTAPHTSNSWMYPLIYVTLGIVFGVSIVSFAEYKPAASGFAAGSSDPVLIEDWHGNVRRSIPAE